MQTFHDQKILAFSPRQMFDVVAAVENYPQFLPLCDELTIRSRDASGAGEVIIADMSVGYGPVRETFTSKVTLEPGEPKILVEYLDGPFRHLENRWLFNQAAGPGGADHCEIDFYIAYEFRSPMLQMLMGGMFETAYRKFVSAFEARAHTVYGAAAQHDNV